MPVSGFGAAYAGAGFVLLWSGLKNTTIRDTLAAFLKGTTPAPHLTGPPTLGVGQAAAAAAPGSTSSSPGAAAPGKPSPGAAANQALARALAVASGHPDWITGQQWNDWVDLWERESGWSATADTRKTGLDPSDATVFAYGIPQARPYTKMPRAAWPPDKGGLADPATQINWGIAYLAQPEYGSPSAAWQHEQVNGWY